MGGPVAVVYLPQEMSADERESVEQMMADRSWRLCPKNHDVMTLHVEPMSFEHDASEVDELESAIGWRPEQQVQLVCHGKSLIEYHKDLATAAARLAREFGGLVMVFVDNRYYEQLEPENVRVPSWDFGGSASERIVGADWLEAFLKLEEPRFRK